MRSPGVGRWTALSACALLALLSVSNAQESATPEIRWRTHGNQVAIFRDVRIAEGEVLPGDLVCIFCDAEVAGEVSGDVVVVLGNLRVEGTLGHDAVAILSNLQFGENATVGGDFVNILGNPVGEPRVSGDRVHIPLVFVPSSMRAPFGVLGTLLTWIAVLWTILLFLLLVIVSAAIPERVRVVTDEIPVSLPLAYLTGLGTYVALFLVNFALAATVIGLPLAGIVWVLFLFFKWIGLAGIYFWIGRALGRAFGREISVLSGVLLGFLPFMLLQLAPVLLGGVGFLIAIGIRILFWLLLEIPAVGLSVLTRGGGRPRSTPALRPIPIAPPLPAEIVASAGAPQPPP